MNYLYKTFIALVAAAATFAGCTTDETGGGDNPTPGYDFRVGVYTDDETDLTWVKGDEITIATVGDNGAFTSIANYMVDFRTISETGDYAEFLGADLAQGAEYIAYRTPLGGSIEGVSNGFQCSYDYQSASSRNTNLMMQSQKFSYDGTMPEIVFENQSSLLELNVSTTSAYSGSISKIDISSTGGDDVFLTTLLFDSTGAIINSGNEGADFEISANAGIPLGTTATTLSIPVSWNKAATSHSVELKFDITTSDFGTSSVTKSVTIAEGGEKSSASLSFAKPVAPPTPANEVWYTTTDGKAVDLTKSDAGGNCFDAQIASNTYSNGRGVIRLRTAVKTVNSCAFQRLSTLRSVILPDGVEMVDGMAFDRCDNLEYITLPASIVDFGWYPVMSCPSIKRFNGDCKFIFADGYALSYTFNFLGDGYFTMIAYANGSGLTSFTVPDNVVNVENYSFYNAAELKEITFPSTINQIGMEAFEGTYPERIYGDNVASDNRSLVVDNKLLYVAGGGLTSYTTPAGVTKLNKGVFGGKPDLETIVLTDEVTETDMYMSNMCKESPNIKSITISAAMKSLNSDPFSLSGEPYRSLKSIYLRAPIPPTIGDQFFVGTPHSYPNLTLYVPKDSYDDYMMNPDWESYRGYMAPYDYGDLSAFDDGSSVDYSEEGEVVTLQSATKGKGVNIVIMGDGFDDTKMADDGEYISRMKEAMECYFSEEPNKTLRDYYNIYTVKAVSRDNGVDENGEHNTAFSSMFGAGTFISGNDSKALRYALKAPGINSTKDLTVLVVLNSDRYAGTCYWYDDGSAVAYCPITGFENEPFRQVIVHEMGHAFGKLMDEYCYDGMGTVGQGDLALFTMRKEQGWASNIDSTNDPDKIQWTHMLNDYRYDAEIGIIEGGLTYEYGIWRPTENSIMRFNTGDYNAPSREAIYKRVKELAGETYSYEEFVAYDAKNVAAAIEANRSSRSGKVDMSTFIPLATPVYIPHKPLSAE